MELTKAIMAKLKQSLGEIAAPTVVTISPENTTREQLENIICRCFFAKGFGIHVDCREGVVHVLAKYIMPHLMPGFMLLIQPASPV